MLTTPRVVGTCIVNTRQRDPMMIYRVTAREKECLILTARGNTYEEIANLLGITRRTVKKHVSDAIDRLNVRNRTQAVALALCVGIISFTEVFSVAQAVQNLHGPLDSDPSEAGE